MKRKNEGDARREGSCALCSLFAMPVARYLESAVVGVILLKRLLSVHPTLSDVDTLFIR